ncbi:MAG: DUF1819 family protein [Desulfoplanes sp.]|nr:DUF1819 family protein [Desulfoplanes sp.]MDD4649369.1 DUF1819 family protein [Desulfoplanes sp.]
MANSHYNGEIVAGALLIRESRLIAEMLHQGLNKQEFDKAILEDNILQKRSPATARRQTQLIRKRLLGLDPSLLSLVTEGSLEQATQAIFCAAIKHNHLIGDFLLKVVSLHMRTFKDQLSSLDWDTFFEDCTHITPSIGLWSDSTKTKIRQVVFRALAEAGVIDSTRSRRIIPFLLSPEVRTLLKTTNEPYVVQCLEAIQ